MKAVILAGGRGSRLRPLTDSVPKPMVALHGKPMMQYTLEALVRAGIDDIAVTLCYKPEAIEAYFGDGSAWGARLKYFVEREPLGTAGGVAAAAAFLDKPFVVASADAWTDLDYGALCAYHCAGGAPVTIAVCNAEDTSSFGVVDVDERGFVTRFREKPEHSDSHLVSMGIYCMDADVLSLIPSGRKYDFARDLFPRLIGKMRVYRSDCRWSDLGTMCAYQSAIADKSSGMLVAPLLSR